jgi:CheY-like chemotaxis protein
MRWLPDCEQEPEEIFEPRAVCSSRYVGPCPRIIWADDNADMRRYVIRLLRDRCDIEAFADGRAALEAARKNPPDLVLSDVMMPRLDGIGLLRALRADPATSECAVILISARAGEENRVEGMHAGAALINQAPLGVYLVDADLRIREVYPVSLPTFGNVPGGVIGRNFDEIVHFLWQKEYADEMVALFRHTLETGEPYCTPERIEERRDSGRTEYYEWRIDRIVLPDGRQRGRLLFPRYLGRGAGPPDTAAPRR